jgi:hypothetical protein
VILGVDHLALSCCDVSAAGNQLQAWGATRAFTDIGLRNDEAKKPFLQHYSLAHDIAYCRFGRGTSIELTRHSSPLRRSLSPYQVLISGTVNDVADWQEPVPPSWAAAFQSLPGVVRPRPVWCEHLAAQFWLDLSGDRQDVGIEAVLVPTTNLDASEHFWVRGLGGRLATAGDRWRRVSYRRPVTSWSVELILAESDMPGEWLPTLDAPGMPCLALLTNHIASDLERARACGGRDTSPAFGLVVNNRSVLITLLRGPSGEIVELIEIPRGVPAASTNHL